MVVTLFKVFASRSVTQDGEQEENTVSVKINKPKSLDGEACIHSAREGGMEGKSPCVSFLSLLMHLSLLCPCNLIEDP